MKISLPTDIMKMGTLTSIHQKTEMKMSTTLEILTRAILGLVFLYLEGCSPFERKIQSEELWLYKYPSTQSYVSGTILWPIVTIPTILVFFAYYLLTKEKNDFTQALLALSLALGVNGTITNIIKIIVGRPRPDFLYRCFPDGVSKWPGDLTDSGILNSVDITSTCTGNEDVIKEGRKSFPSGHSSFAFCSFGFLALWMCGKLQVFSQRRGDGWRLVAVLIPLMAALSIALSRTCDYHHHWQDVLVGSLLGLLVSYTCYRQYFPCLSSPESNLSLLTVAELQKLPYSVVNNDERW